MPIRWATSRSVIWASPSSRATAQAASTISRRVASRRSAFLSLLGVSNTLRNILAPPGRVQSGPAQHRQPRHTTRCEFRTGPDHDAYSEGMTEERESVDINWVQVSASALAAVSSAVLLSTVGVAGTLIGAAIGSVVATVGSSVYASSLRASRARVAAAQAAALTRVGRARASVSGARADVRDQSTRAQAEIDQARSE